MFMFLHSRKKKLNKNVLFIGDMLGFWIKKRLQFSLERLKYKKKILKIKGILYNANMNYLKNVENWENGEDKMKICQGNKNSIFFIPCYLVNFQYFSKILVHGTENTLNFNRNFEFLYCNAPDSCIHFSKWFLFRTWYMSYKSYIFHFFFSIIFFVINSKCRRINLENHLSNTFFTISKIT